MKNWNLIEKAFALKKSLLFAELDLDLLLAIADKMNISTFEQDEIIFPLHQEAHKMYLVVEGSVIIEDHKDKIIAILHCGELFGDESLFNDLPRAYTAKANQRVVLLTLSKTHLLTIISECPTVALSLLYAYTSNIGFRKRN